MIDNYPVATICGSMKLGSQMRIVADELTRQGCIVLAPFTRKAGNSLSVKMRIERLSERDDKVYDPDGNHLNATPISGAELDLMHLTKIEAADRVVIVTDFAHHLVTEDEARKHETGFYIGESTRNEIAHAHDFDIPVEFARIERQDYRDTIIWLSPAVGTKLAATFART